MVPAAFFFDGVLRVGWRRVVHRGGFFGCPPFTVFSPLDAHFTVFFLDFFMV
jgi:hypothetical protein